MSKEMRKTVSRPRFYMGLIKTFIRKSIQKEMAFGVNFFVNSLNTLLGLAGGLAGIFILFSRVPELNGWTVAEVLAVLGVYMLVDGIKNLFIGPSLGSIAGMDGDLWLGRFDFTLLKPVPVQFHVSFRNWNPWALMNVIAGAGVLAVSAVKLGHAMTAAGLLYFFAALVVSLLLVYSVMLLLIACAFWYLGSPLVWIYDSLIQLGRFPVKIYPGFLKALLTWVIPVGFIVTVPAEVLAGDFSVGTLAGGGVLAVGLFIAASLLFGAGLKKYASASS